MIRHFGAASFSELRFSLNDLSVSLCLGGHFTEPRLSAASSLCYNLDIYISDIVHAINFRN